MGKLIPTNMTGSTETWEKIENERTYRFQDTDQRSGSSAPAPNQAEKREEIEREIEALKK